MAVLVKELKKQDVIAQLKWNDNISTENIDVEVFDSKVLLTGNVSGYAEKIIIEESIEKISGVTSIENLIRVEIPPKNKLVSDDELTDNIEKLISMDERLGPVNIKIDVHDGIVTVSGEVDRFWKKKLIEKIIYPVKGIINIINNISVNLSERINDNAIIQDIKKACKRNVLTNEDVFDIYSTNGVVVLKGIVFTYPLKNEAFEVAMNTKGVVNVLNELIVS